METHHMNYVFFSSSLSFMKPQVLWNHKLYQTASFNKPQAYAVFINCKLYEKLPWNRKIISEIHDLQLIHSQKGILDFRMWSCWKFPFDYSTKQNFIRIIIWNINCQYDHISFHLKGKDIIPLWVYTKLGYVNLWLNFVFFMLIF